MKMKKVLLIVFGIIIVMALTIAAIFVFNLPDESKSDKEGTATEQPKEEKEPPVTEEENEKPKEIKNPGPLGKFTTLDLNENKVTADIITKNKVTLIDVWATWCGPCAEAMPYLEEVNQYYKGKDVGVVGILTDGQGFDGNPDPAQLKLARSILKKKGASYKNIIVPSEAEKLINSLEYYPSVFVVDSKGKKISKVYSGVHDSEDLIQIIENALNK
ncbi:MAG: redoxin family protein [Anaerovoracaceae bacterium]